MIMDAILRGNKFHTLENVINIQTLYMVNI